MAHFLVDADSVVFRAGCSIEDRYYLVLDADGNITGRHQKKQTTEAALHEGYTLVRHKEFKDGMDAEQALIVAKGRLKEVMSKVLMHKDCTSYEVWIGGNGNFRKDLYPEYKGHRDDFARPILEDELRQYLITKYGAKLTSNEEAEDVVSYRSLRLQDAVIAHIDKDLDNTPGRHFNYVTGDEYFITQEEADLNLYRQCLTGDSTDNIPGIAGMGPVKAAKILPEYESVDEMWKKVVAEYVKAGHDYEYALLMLRLVYIRREENEMITPNYITGVGAP